MSNKNLFYILAITICITSMVVHAEVAYVTDKIKIGLHQEASNESPIIKLVPSGTKLNIIERENDLIYAEEPEGVRGWVNSQNILNSKPGRTKVIELETVNKELEKKILSLQNESEKSISNEELEKKLNTERLKVGELQVELTNIKSKAGNIESNDKLLADINHLKNANKQLINQLESSEIVSDENGNQISSKNSSLKFISFMIIFIFGVIGGILILDFINRRRHGGFRV
jgi:SH3 domain protein